MKLKEIVLVAALCVAAVELASTAFYFYLKGKIFYLDSGRDELRAAAAIHRPARLLIHPYVGYTQAPRNEYPWEYGPSDAASVRKRAYQPCQYWGEQYASICENARNLSDIDYTLITGIHVNNLGQTSRYDIPFAAEPDTLTVAVFGGSVALAHYAYTVDEIAGFGKELEKQLGRHIVFHMFGTGGQKQPQHVSNLIQALAFGQDIDVILNIDGFNEAYVSWLNAREGVSPVYPTKFLLDQIRKLDLSDLTESRLAAERQKIGNSIFAVEYFIRRQVYELSSPATLDAKIDSIMHVDRTTSKTMDTKEVARVWADGSLNMYLIAKGHGIEYIHVLQPNQYVSGKRLTEKEVKEFNVLGEGDAPLKTIIPEAYAAFREQGRELTRRGVNFFDATPLFDDVADSVFNDWCCHMTRRGHEILQKRIVEKALVSALKNSVSNSEN